MKSQPTHPLCLACLVLTVFLAIALPLPTRAQTVESLPARVDAFMAERMQALRIPGAALAIVQGDQVLYLQSYGSARTGIPTTPQTPFLLASLSKSFTALAVLQLVEAGRLDLDAPVQQTLPWFSVQGEGAQAITARHLLHHTGGFSEASGYSRNLDPNTPDGLEASIRRLADQRLVRLPGTAFEYSNTSYDILGVMIETITGQSYEQYVRQHIFEPLAMTHAHTSLAEARADGMSSGYYPFMGFPIVFDRWMLYTRAVLPSAGLIASAEDLSHYLVAQLNAGHYAGKQILSPAGVQMLHTPGVEISPGVDYGMGWLIFDWPEIGDPGAAVPRAVSHSGRWEGFASNIVLLPEQNIATLVLLNANDPLRESVYTNVGFDLARLALGLAALNAPPSEDFLDQYGRVIGVSLILLLAAGNLLLARPRKQAAGRLLFGLWYALDLALAAYVVSIVAGYPTVMELVCFVPDVALVCGLLLLLTLGLGTLRTLHAFRKI